MSRDPLRRDVLLRIPALSTGLILLGLFVPGDSTQGAPAYALIHSTVGESGLTGLVGVALAAQVIALLSVRWRVAALTGALLWWLVFCSFVLNARPYGTIVPLSSALVLCDVAALRAAQTLRRL